MRIDNLDAVQIEITLSRRNLLALLAKVDGHPPESACAISKACDPRILVVRAEPDDVHYADHPAGPMSPETERWIAERDG